MGGVSGMRRVIQTDLYADFRAGATWKFPGENDYALAHAAQSRQEGYIYYLGSVRPTTAATYPAMPHPTASSRPRARAVASHWLNC